MTFGTWNFFESGHRKGVPDGVGATIRRMSDRIAHQGSDCKDATDVYTNLNSAYSKVQLLPCTSRGHWNFNSSHAVNGWPEDCPSWYSNYDIVAEDISSPETLTGRNYQLDPTIIAEVESAL